MQRVSRTAAQQIARRSPERTSQRVGSRPSAGSRPREAQRPIWRWRHPLHRDSRRVNRALVETTCTGRTRRRKRLTSSARWRTDFQGRPATSILATPDGHYFSPKQISLVRVRTNSRPSAMAGVATILSSRRFLASTLSCSSAASTITVPFSPAT